MPLRKGVRWHDEPFTARDVKCTWDLLTGRSAEKFRLNPRKTWYSNLEEVTTNGDYEVTFRLKRPQPSFPALPASGWSPVYPCHVSPRDMRASDRHWPVQIRRIPAERADPGRKEPGVLETGPPLSRRHRLQQRECHTEELIETARDESQDARRQARDDPPLDQQSMESEPEKRRRPVWDIEKKLIEDDVRPVLFHPRAAVCNQP